MLASYLKKASLLFYLLATYYIHNHIYIYIIYMMQLRYISSIEVRLRCWEQIPTHSQEIEIPRILPSRIVPLFPGFSEHTHITPRESNVAIEHPL